MFSHYQTLTPNQCAEKIVSAGKITAFTGAGISTAAGIPDFRGPRGLYTTLKYDPDLVFEINHFRKAPEMFYQFSRDFIQILKTIKPTFTHQFLATLEARGHLLGVITQNIDALHHQAGSRALAEIHGSYWKAECIECPDFSMEAISPGWWETQMEDSQKSPVVLCPCCGGTVKPDIVFFGEPVHDMEMAEKWVRQCDLLLVLGSSLMVYPAAFLPQMTQADIIIVNRGEVAIAPSSNRYFIDEDLDQFFKKVIDFIDSHH